MRSRNQPSKRTQLRVTRVFFLPLLSRKFDDRLSSNFQRFVILCLCWETPTVKASLWQLPIVSTTFNVINFSMSLIFNSYNLIYSLSWCRPSWVTVFLFQKKKGIQQTQLLGGSNLIDGFSGQVHPVMHVHALKFVRWSVQFLAKVYDPYSRPHTERTAPVHKQCKTKVSWPTLWRNMYYTFNTEFY